MGRISDSHGEMMDNAGYERGGDLGGGWSEHDSGDGYESTRDRMDRHLSRYGKDESYTNAFNDRNSSGWGGGRSAISGAVNNTRSSIGSSKHNSLTNNTLAQVTNPSASVKGSYSPNIDPNYTPNIFDKYAAENFQHAKNIAAHDFIKDTNRTTALNAIGGMYSQPVAEGIISKATSPGKALMGVAAGALIGKIGDAANAVAGQQSRDSLSKEGRAMYDGAYGTYTSQKNAHRDDLEDKARGFIAGAVDALTNPIGAFSSLNSIYSDNKALIDTATVFKDVSEFQSYMDGRQNRGYQSLGDGSKEEPKGILGVMHKRANQSVNSSNNQRLINAIPTLTNFWKNITIK